MKIAIVIPAQNEEDSITQVLNEIPQEFRSQTVVVDNNSTDSTASKVQALGVAVIEESRPGYGSACLKGVSYAEKYFQFDTLVFLDGDYSDFPVDIYRLVKKAKQDNLDLVIGSRNLGEAELGSMVPQARFGNWLATTLMNLFTGSKFTDLGPFRLIKKAAYDRLAMVDTNFGWTMEMQIKAIKLSLNCGEVSVRYKKRIGVSKISGTIKGSVLAGYKILFTLFRYLGAKPLPVAHSPLALDSNSKER